METSYIGRNRQYFDSIESTNNYASSQAGKTGIPEGTLVRAGYQSAGRGQAGNSWESRAGENLTFSLILYPRFLAPERQFFLSEAISLAITDFLLLYLEEARIKWPNDIYAGGKKIGGILIEHAVVGQVLAHSIVGIGLNINQTEFSPELPNPVSLRMLTGERYDPGLCLDLLCATIEKRYDSLKKGSFEQLEHHYLSRLIGRGSWLKYRDREESFEACIRSVEPMGTLVLEDRKGETRKYTFREVDLLPDQEV